MLWILSFSVWPEHHGPKTPPQGPKTPTQNTTQKPKKNTTFWLKNTTYFLKNCQKWPSHRFLLHFYASSFGKYLMLSWNFLRIFKKFLSTFENNLIILNWVIIFKKCSHEVAFYAFLYKKIENVWKVPLFNEINRSKLKSHPF